MQVWRLARAAYATDLSGYGAALFGGRWNHRDVPAVYTATSRALAVLEVLAHLPEPGLMPDDYQLISIDLPDDPALFHTLAPPTGWDAVPAGDTSRDAGTGWLKQSGQLGLYLPSVIVPLDRNMLLNPAHPLLRDGTIQAVIEGPFDFDGRVLNLLA
ncbi:RES family NAD+ phosphorylase [Andreprevotia chitinilytica]|uniref:RES family NAD+ phosphorylase n=1 Tax=Andreprevotia chitinilytica TaxID=396808 RepID=UPI0005558FBC|nr:RES family NAD+ phosphorylase [Andreprevotia chitinilytica]